MKLQLHNKQTLLFCGHCFLAANKTLNNSTDGSNVDNT